MLSEKFSHFLDKPLTPLAKALPVNPNVITFIGMLITSSSGFIIPFNLFLGGIFILAGGAFDLIDGIVARVNGRATRFGALLDSTFDRIADGFIFLGISWYFFRLNDEVAFIVTVLCMIASFLISYVRARAEAVGACCSVGIIERPERLISLAFGCLTGLLYPVLVILTILSWITVIQRIFYARKQIKNLLQ
ncbi:CDP-alcohol phosphatidyltransferase family protein [Thermodesulfovibrio sp.]|uniref:CDP-alcohol phosphatidyltransferase family protein n=1 Tax=Thermodesulfovibrio sp. TaxID=2067987 RepID=UPI003C7D4C7D